MAAPHTPAWDRHRAALRAEITDAALELFVTQGFDATTIDQVATSVGISRRSFFRYFGTKEDVLLGDLVARGEAIARALAARPPGEDVWDALKCAMVDAREETMPDAASDLAIGRMMIETPSLRARHLEKRLRWQELLVPLVAARLTGPHRDLRAAAVVAAALACLDVASEAWIASDGEDDLEALYDRALSAVRAEHPVDR